MRSLTYDIEFRARARRAEAWGFVLLGVAGLLWVWFAVLLLMPFENERGYDCDGQLFSERTRTGRWCEAERDWPELLGVLGLSVPVSVVGAVLHTSGSTRNRMSEHAAEVARLNEAADRG